MSDITLNDVSWMIGVIVAFEIGWISGYDRRDREEFAKTHPWFRRYL